MVTHQSEKGQALVLIVLGIVAMFGFAALAIDGGRVYSDRRNAQNAADTAALTGAAEIADFMSSNGIFHWSWSDLGGCNSWLLSAKPSAYTAAINRAFSNDFIIDTDISDNNGVSAVCGSTAYIGFTDYYIDVTTMITTETPPSFAQLVFSGPLRQTVTAVARIHPQTPIGIGNAIIALNPAGCQGNQNGAQFDGNDYVYINGGGVFSNGCMGISGTSLVIDVDDGGNTYVDELDVSGGPSVSPWPAQGTEPLPSALLVIDPPTCSGPTQSWPGGDATINPGNYSGNFTVTNNQDIVMNPGLYCIDGTFRVNGGTVDATSGVTIYMEDGDFLVTGGVVQFHAPTGLPDPSPALPNVVIYMAESNDGEVSMLGNAGSSYQGTVYAPTGEIEVGGTSGINPTYSTQLIGWNVFVHGTAEININFEDALAFQYPPRLDLEQ